MSERMPTVQLAGGVEVPQVGFGVFQIPADETQRAVEAALEAGYRHIDTAAAYVNEAGVGAGLRASGLPRDEVFITTKLRNGDQGSTEARVALAESLDRLGLDRVDLYLVHWPSPARDAYVDSWRTLAELQREGVARAIGVSNFLQEHLTRILDETGVVPAVDQIELHPTFQQRLLVEFASSKGIAIEAHSPLGQGVDLGASAVVETAAELGVTPAQVVLRWHLQNGTITIPKSASPERMRANLDVLGFELDERQRASIAALDTDQRIGGDPASFEISQIR